MHDLAEHGSRRVLGAVSGPLTDDLLGRVAIGYTDVDGWGENTFTGEYVNGRKEETLRLSLARQPTTDLGADLMLERSNQQANPATINVAPVAPGQPTSPFIRREDLDAPLDNTEFSFDEPSDNQTDATNAVPTVKWELGDANCPLASGQRAWCGTQAYSTGSFDLSPFAGQSVRFRFRAITDSSTGTLPHGWYVDDIRVESCQEGLFFDGFE